MDKRNVLIHLPYNMVDYVLTKSRFYNDISFFYTLNKRLFMKILLKNLFYMYSIYNEFIDVFKGILCY